MCSGGEAKSLLYLKPLEVSGEHQTPGPPPPREEGPTGPRGVTRAPGSFLGLHRPAASGTGQAGGQLCARGRPVGKAHHHEGQGKASHPEELGGHGEAPQSPDRPGSRPGRLVSNRSPSRPPASGGRGSDQGDEKNSYISGERHLRSVCENT